MSTRRTHALILPVEVDGIVTFNSIIVNSSVSGYYEKIIYQRKRLLV